MSTLLALPWAYPELVEGLIFHSLFSILKVSAMKKILLFLVFFALMLSFPLLSFAQSPTQEVQPVKTQYPLNTNSDVPQNFHTYTQNVFIEILASAVCITSGVDILSADGKCLGIDTATKKIGYVNSSASGGLAGAMTGLIGATYNLPASSGTYIHYLAGNFGITRNSYASLIDTGDGGGGGGTKPSQGFGKGIGFEGLTPVLEIWRVFRNHSYMVFVLIFMIVGLGIMFRVNIDARTVMTIQNQIPKIIIALVLITMSYAIAGFLIDMMYLSIYLLVHVFDSQKLGTVTNMSTPFSAISGFGGVGNLASPTAESASGIFRSIFEGTLGGNLSKIVTTVAGAMLGGTSGGGPFGMIGKLVGGGLGALVGQPGLGSSIGGALGGYVIGGIIGASKGPDILQFVAGIIVYLIIIIAILSALFRTWISLLKAYIFILIDVIFAPFFIMGGLVPGSPGGGFGSWIRSMLGNLAAFPTVLTLFLIGAAVQAHLSTDATGNFIPPLVGVQGDDTVKNIGSLIGIGIVLIMPESIAITKAAFKSPERKLAASAFRAVGQGQNFWGKPAGGIWKDLWGEKKDGSRGVLRGAAEDRALKIAKTFGVDRIPLVKKYRIAKANNKRRANAMHYGHEYKPVTEAELGYDEGKGRLGLFRRKKPDTADSPIATGPSAGGSTVTASGATTVPAGSASATPSDNDVNAEYRRLAMSRGINPDMFHPDADKIRAEARQNLTNRSTSGSSGVIATTTSNNPGAGGANTEDVRDAAFEGAQAGASRGTSTAPGGSARNIIEGIEDAGIARGSGDASREPKKDA